MNKKIKDYIYTIYELTKRNMIIFFKNKTTIFFSLIAPVLILFIYLVFMSDMQTELILDSYPNITLNKTEVNSLINSWLIAGIVGIASLTVALNSMFITILDREKKTINDFKASPINNINLTLSYFISAFIITFILTLSFIIIGNIYLIISGGNMFLFNFKETIWIILLLIISTLSSVIILMFITSFFEKTSTAASFTGVFTALIGFLIGAYLPISYLPKYIQNIANLLPGSHVTALFRQVFMEKILSSNEFVSEIPKSFIIEVKNNYGYNLILFDHELSKSFMVIYILLTSFIFFGLLIGINKIRDKSTKNGN